MMDSLFEDDDEPASAPSEPAPPPSGRAFAATSATSYGGGSCGGGSSFSSYSYSRPLPSGSAPGSALASDLGAIGLYTLPTDRPTTSASPSSPGAAAPSAAADAAPSGAHAAAGGTDSPTVATPDTEGAPCSDAPRHSRTPRLCTFLPTPSPSPSHVPPSGTPRRGGGGGRACGHPQPAQPVDRREPGPAAAQAPKDCAPATRWPFLLLLWRRHERRRRKGRRTGRRERRRKGRRQGRRRQGRRWHKQRKARQARPRRRQWRRR